MTRNHVLAGLAVGLSILATASGSAGAASYSASAQGEAAAQGSSHTQLELVQHRRGYGPYGGYRGYYGPGPRFSGPGPRYHGGGPRFFGPPGYYGRPYWYARPWYARPYYGTIIAGVALGTIITVGAVGYAPPRPAPDLCWYWVDEYASRGYWDYCR